MPDHVAICEVHDDEPVTTAFDSVDYRRAYARGAHFRLQDHTSQPSGEGTSVRSSPSNGVLAPAVQKKRHMRVLFCFRDVELRESRFADDASQVGKSTSFSSKITVALRSSMYCVIVRRSIDSERSTARSNPVKSEFARA